MGMDGVMDDVDGWRDGFLRTMNQLIMRNLKSCLSCVEWVGV
jgi:hypothetical protein